MMLGSRCRTTMRVRLIPMAISASTYSDFDAEMTDVRKIRP